MKVSLRWLQNYFDEPLPSADAVADAFTFHSFEVDERDGDLFDLKVLPDRAGYGLSHRGAAYELAAALDRPLSADPLRVRTDVRTSTALLHVAIADPARCSRYMAALVKGVTVGPSPAWLKEALESLGQRSINNIVDATNYVMLDLGQPLHAFDASKLLKEDGAYAIVVRGAREGEKITTLTGDEYELTPERLLIVDGNADAPIGIAGVKGGSVAEITEATTDIIIESANFDGTSVRRTAQALHLVTDASLRFQNRPSPELAAYGMRAVLELIKKTVGGEVVGVTDVYPTKAHLPPVSTTLSRINGLLGSNFTTEEAQDVFRRLDLPYEVTGETFTVTPPFERTDLVIPEDLAEEVGRIMGYERVAPTELPPIKGTPDQARYRGIERMKDQLVEQGFTEVSTQSFAKEGEVYLANPLDKTRPALRRNLSEGLRTAEVTAAHTAPLFLKPGTPLKIFEIGTIFSGDGEHIEKGTMQASQGDYQIIDTFEEDSTYVPKRYQLGTYRPFSAYPFVLRDIALWVPVDTQVAAIEQVIRESAGDVLVRLDLFDRFEKEGRVSYAFRLVFNAPDRTLTDEEVNVMMGNISAALTQKDYEIR